MENNQPNERLEKREKERKRQRNLDARNFNTPSYYERYGEPEVD